MDCAADLQHKAHFLWKRDQTYNYKLVNWPKKKELVRFWSKNKTELDRKKKQVKVDKKERQFEKENKSLQIKGMPVFS